MGRYRERKQQQTFNSRCFPPSSKKFEQIDTRLKETSFLNAGLKIIIKDSREEDENISEHHYEGGLSELHNILVRMRELSVQASNETYYSTDRAMIATEMGQLKEEYDRITTTANFNRVDILKGSGTAFTIQVGIHNNADNRININLASLNSTLGAVGLSFGANGGITGSGSLANAQSNISTIDSALSEIATRRARLGAIQNRLENALSEATNYSENLSSAQSQIIDVDYATESADMTRYQIQQQAGVAALSQAKAIPQSIMSLLS